MGREMEWSGKDRKRKRQGREGRKERGEGKGRDGSGPLIFQNVVVPLAVQASYKFNS